jgi:hypothetical protein
MAGRANDGCGPGTKDASWDGEGSGLVAAGDDGMVGRAAGCELGASVVEGPGVRPAPATGEVDTRDGGAVVKVLGPHAASIEAAHSTATSPLAFRFMVRPISAISPAPSIRWLAMATPVR